MPVNAGTVQRQHQTTGMVPEHLVGKAVLKMSLNELQHYVASQIAENPALVMEEESRCPACGCNLVGDFCPACGSENNLESHEASNDGEEWQETQWTSAGQADDDYYEPFASVASPKSLDEHLKEQIRISVQGEKARIAEFLIDSLDEDGYLRENLLEIANGFGMSVPQLEEVLRLVQSLDPAGVGARDLRECLLIQISQLDDDSYEKLLAESIIRNHWEDVEHLKLDKVASRLGVDTASVADALAFIRDNLNPHPSSTFRDPWSKMAPRKESKQAPDVVVRVTENGLVADILDPVTGKAAIDEIYNDLYAEIIRKRNSYPQGDSAHIKECVQSARALIEALEYRKTTLHYVAEELVRYQADFITKGPAHLKPLTQKELAKRIGVHESTICRATSDKTMQLPSGEVITFDVFFDSALPVKELVRRFAMERKNGHSLSDGEIAARITAMGFQIARRTVAKYRDQLRVLPLEYRQAQPSTTSTIAA